MRLFKRGDYYYVELAHNKTSSLHTKDDKEAEAIFREMEKEELRGRLFQIDKAILLDLSEFTALYIDHRKNVKDISPETIRKDKLALKLLADAIGATTPMAAIAVKRSRKISEFKDICIARGASKITVNGYLRHLKSAFKWAARQEYIDRLPDVDMFKRLKKDDKGMLRHILDPAEIAVIRRGH